MENRERKERGKRKEEIFRVRSSHFSLGFLAIGLVNSSEARSKVGLCCKGYVWVPVLWSFDNSKRLGFSPTCFIPRLRSIRRDRDVLRLEGSCFSVPKIGVQW